MPPVERPLDIVVTGGTGYIGNRLCTALVAHAHRVRVIARAQSLSRVPAGTTGVAGDVFDEGSVAGALRPGDTIIHLVGTPHPSPAKAAEFVSVDLASIRAVSAAASRVNAAHLVYVSVAQPAPVMKAYQQVRAQGEAMIRAAGVTATFVRPWYVLGPGHWWPVALIPMYALASWIPPLSDGARRLGLVTLSQMVGALVAAAEHPPGAGEQLVMDVPAIRAAKPA